jgi:hypothetical protein
VILAIECGLKIEEFWALSWREFLLYRKGYEERLTRGWEQSRLIGYMIYADITKHEKSRKTISEWLPLKSDVVEDVKYLSSEEFIASQNKFAEALKKKKNGRKDP